MVDIREWVKTFSAAIEEAFEDRLLFIGLQGSYGRGEATEDSDIDPVVILDHLDAADIKTYERVIDFRNPGGQLHGYRRIYFGFDLSGRESLSSRQKYNIHIFKIQRGPADRF